MENALAELIANSPILILMLFIWQLERTRAQKERLYYRSVVWSLLRMFIIATVNEDKIKPVMESIKVDIDED